MGKKNKGKTGLAAAADRYTLYERAVQEPEADVEFSTDVYRDEFGAPPRLLREDFCGTAGICRDWVRAHPANRAWGIDLDPEPLAWGREHNIAPLPASARDRVVLIEGDVMTAETPPADVIMALNFSYFLFTERAQLLHYLRACHEHLGPRGMLVLDAYGGPDSVIQQKEETEYDGFSYVWDQHDFDPIGRLATCHIHFKFSDGSKLKRAFSYHWRMYTIPEIRELLVEAGFDDTKVYWEGTDGETGEGDGVYSEQERADPDDAWICYIAAFKR